MANLIVVVFMPSQRNEQPNSAYVKTQLRRNVRKYPLLEQDPGLLIISPCTLTESIARAFPNVVVREIAKEGNGESHGSEKGSTNRRRKEEKVNLNAYCEGLPQGKYALAVLEISFYSDKVVQGQAGGVIKWLYKPDDREIERTIVMTTEEKKDWGSYALDDLRARLQLRGLAEAQRELRQREEEGKQKEAGFNLDSIRSTLRELPGRLPAPTRCTLPRPPQVYSVDISALQQSTEALLSSVHLLKSKLHKST